MSESFKVELANKIRNGRAVGNLWGVGRYVKGCRAGYALTPQESEAEARLYCATRNEQERSRSEDLARGW